MERGNDISEGEGAELPTPPVWILDLKVLEKNEKYFLGRVIIND